MDAVTQRAWEVRVVDRLATFDPSQGLCDTPAALAAGALKQAARPRTRPGSLGFEPASRARAIDPRR